MATVDLWPEEITVDDVVTGPATMLKEQAAMLSKRTKNLVKVELANAIKKTTQGDKLISHFVLVGPLIDYRYTLFWIEYPIEFYPAILYFNEWKTALIARDEEELENLLRDIFSHHKTVRIINAIISRSKEEQFVEIVASNNPDEE